MGLELGLLAIAAEELGFSGKRPVVINRFQIRDTQIEHICWALKTESLFKTVFRQFTGEPVHQCVIQKRVARAALLLVQGKLSISEAAQETGFAHQSRLAKHMQRVLGWPPKAV